VNSHFPSSFTLKENNIPPFLIVQTPQKRAVGTHFDSSRVSDSPSSSTPFPNFVFYFFQLSPPSPSSHYLHALQLHSVHLDLSNMGGCPFLFLSLSSLLPPLSLYSLPQSLSLSLSTQVFFHRFPYYSCYTPDCFPSSSPWYLLSIPALHPIIFLLPSSLPSHPPVKPPEFLFSSFFLPASRFLFFLSTISFSPLFIFLRSTLFSLANRLSRRLV